MPPPRPMTLADVVAACRFSPYPSSNPAGYVTGKTIPPGAVSKAGDTMQGPLLLTAEIRFGLQAATKAYCDAVAASAAQAAQAAQAAAAQAAASIPRPGTGALTVRPTFGGGAAGMGGSFSGRYAVWGPLVSIQLRLAWTAAGTDTGALLIDLPDLPVPAGDLIAQPLSVGASAGIGAAGALHAQISGSTVAVLKSQRTDDPRRDVVRDDVLDTSYLEIAGLFAQ